jgi:hypothetical protein
MKRLFFEWIWQWVGGPYIGFNPIGIELEYDKFGPTITFMVVLMGVGFQVTWLGAWKTEESQRIQQGDYLLSIDPREFSPDVE